MAKGHPNNDAYGVRVIEQINRPEDIAMAGLLNKQLGRLLSRNELVKLSDLKAYEIVQSIGQDSAMEIGLAE